MAKGNKKDVKSDKKGTVSAEKELLIAKRKLSKLRKKIKKERKDNPQPMNGPAAEPVADVPLRSPFAPDAPAAVPAIAGVQFATACTGLKYQGRDDVMLALLDPGTSLAGAFTRSLTRSAAVLDCETKIRKLPNPGDGAAILVNAGNANAFTGRNGADTVAAISAAAARATGVPDQRVFTASTGVIGEPLDPKGVTDTLAGLTANLSPDKMPDAARAIMTTDTFAKTAARTVEVGGNTINIAGFAKGSGMIAPDMATMLVYIFTDAKIRLGPLRRLITRLTDETFNCITVDSDTSTSDTLLVAATGTYAGPEIKDLRSRDGKIFADALGEVMLDLAHQVVKDGEGATKFVEISVRGAANPRDARKIALAIANSPLVKTALAGEDPNWGRIVMAVGKSGASAHRDKLKIHFGDLLVAENGWVAESYSEEAGAAYMKQAELKITVDIGIGRGTATIWTCDFTKRYIEINADYRS